MFLNATKMSCYFSSFCLFVIVVVTVSFLFFVSLSLSLSLWRGVGEGGNGQTVRGERRRKTQGDTSEQDDLSRHRSER